jgi:hypothetical protein
MTEVLLELPVFAKLSQRVWRVLGFNPGKFTLQGNEGSRAICLELQIVTDGGSLQELIHTLSALAHENYYWIVVKERRNICLASSQQLKPFLEPSFQISSYHIIIMTTGEEYHPFSRQN